MCYETHAGTYLSVHACIRKKVKSILNHSSQRVARILGAVYVSLFPSVMLAHPPVYVERARAFMCTKLVLNEEVFFDEVHSCLEEEEEEENDDDDEDDERKCNLVGEKF